MGASTPPSNSNIGSGILCGGMPDEDIDVYDEQEILWAIATRVEGDKDIAIIPKVTGAHLDPTTYDETCLKGGPMTSKMIIDATKPVTLPFATRITPPEDLWSSMQLADYLSNEKPACWGRSV